MDVQIQTVNDKTPAFGWFGFIVTEDAELVFINAEGKKFKVKMEEVVEPKEVDEYPPNGLLCASCRTPQYMTPSGPCCVNSHGGCDGIEP